jgi:hypothetical protein
MWLEIGRWGLINGSRWSALWPSAAKLLTRDEARIAANFAKLADLLGPNARK